MPRNIRETLTVVALSRPGVGFFLHRGPEIALSERFEHEGSPNGVVRSDSLMNFLEDLIRLYTIEA